MDKSQLRTKIYDQNIIIEKLKDNMKNEKSMHSKDFSLSSNESNIINSIDKNNITYNVTQIYFHEIINFPENEYSPFFTEAFHIIDDNTISFSLNSSTGGGLYLYKIDEKQYYKIFNYPKDFIISKFVMTKNGLFIGTIMLHNKLYFYNTKTKNQYIIDLPYIAREIILDCEDETIIYLSLYNSYQTFHCVLYKLLIKDAVDILYGNTQTNDYVVAHKIKRITVIENSQNAKCNLKLTTIHGLYMREDFLYFSTINNVYKINKKTYWIECLIGNIKYLPLYQNISSLHSDNLCIAIFNNKKKVNIIDNRDGIIIKSGRINNIKLLCKFSIFLFQLLKINFTNNSSFSRKPVVNPITFLKYNEKNNEVNYYTFDKIINDYNSEISHLEFIKKNLIIAVNYKENSFVLVNISENIL